MVTGVSEFEAIIPLQRLSWHGGNGKLKLTRAVPRVDSKDAFGTFSGYCGCHLDPSLWLMLIFSLPALSPMAACHLLMALAETLSWNCYLLKGTLVYTFSWLMWENQDTGTLTQFRTPLKDYPSSRDLSEYSRCINMHFLPLPNSASLTPLVMVLQHTSQWTGTFTPKVCFQESWPKIVPQVTSSKLTFDLSHILSECFMQTRTYLKWARSHLNHVLCLFTWSRTLISSIRSNLAFTCAEPRSAEGLMTSRE